MYRSRLSSATPLAAFLLLLGIASWAGREELKAAIEASGSFVAAQFGQARPSKAAKTPAKSVPTVTTTSAKVAPKKPAKGAEETQPKVVVEVDYEGRKLKIMDAPVPADCHPQKHMDYGGDAVVWGLGHKQASAAECCAACKEHAGRHPDKPCNIWVWCGDPSGVCWTMDIHNHTTGDCWLKHQADWDNNPDLSKSNLVVNHKGKFPDDFRAVHKTAPEMVPWVAGVVPAKKARRLRRGGV